MDNDFQPVVGHKFSFRATPMPNWNGVVDCEVLVVEPNQRLSYSWSSLAAIIILLLIAGKAMPGESGRLEQILSSRVPKEVRRFADYLESGAITVETTGVSMYASGGKRAEGKSSTLIKKHLPFYLLRNEEEEAPPSLLQLCYGINSKYSFELTRNTSNRRWVISKVVFVTPDFDEKKARFRLLAEGGFRRLADNFLSSLTSVYLAHGNGVDGGVPVDNLFDLPGFRVDSLSLQGPDDSILRAVFHYELTDPELKKPCRSDCIMDFNLGMDCLPTKLQQCYKIGPKELRHDWQREWLKEAEGNYTVKFALDRKSASGSATKDLCKVRTTMKVTKHELPEADFTLSAFGFPEPPGVEWSRPFPYYLVAAGIGIVCVGGFFLIRSRARCAGAGS